MSDNQSSQSTEQRFRNTGVLMRDEMVAAEFEKDEKQYPNQVGKLYIDGNWFDVAQARELRDFLNQVLPPEQPIVGTEEGETCNRDDCTGTMEYKRQGECTCHLSPPCGSCVNQILTCTECDFEVE